MNPQIPITELRSNQLMANFVSFLPHPTFLSHVIWKQILDIISFYSLVFHYKSLQEKHFRDILIYYYTNNSLNH